MLGASSSSSEEGDDEQFANDFEEISDVRLILFFIFLLFLIDI